MKVNTRVLVGLLLLGFAACASSPAGPGATDPGPDAVAEGDSADAPPDDPGGLPKDGLDAEPDGKPVGCATEILPLHDTSVPISTLPGETFTVRAKVLDTTKGKPAAGLTIHFAITRVVDADGNTVDQFDGTFESADVQTDSDGFVSDGFRTLAICGITYTLELSPASGNCGSTSLDVSVPCLVCGCANVALAYDGVFPASSLVDFDLYVLPETYGCDQLQSGTPAPVDSVIADRTIGNLSGTAGFDCLPAGSYYTLYGVGHRAGSPCVVTSGCNEGMFVKPGACANQTVKMYDLLLNPTGPYDCIDHFDFTNVVKQCTGGDTTVVSCTTDTGDLGQRICCVLAETIQFFANPGLTLIETLQSLASPWVGTLIAENTFGLFKDAVAKVVTDWVLNSSPPYVQDFMRFGNAMIQTITQAELTSSLRLSKLNNNFSMQGDQSWKTLVLYWGYGCAPASPDYLQCSRIVLDLEALDILVFPKILQDGKFTALMADYDKLIIDQHAIGLNYGRMVQYVLNEVVIKRLTGGKAHSLTEVAHLWLDCTALSQGILAQVATTFGGTQADIEGICNQAVDSVIAGAVGWIDRLSIDTPMYVSGSARLVDSNCDNMVEKITKGQTAGYVQGGASQVPITGDFECMRL